MDDVKQVAVACAREFIRVIDDMSAEPMFRLTVYLYYMAVVAESPETCPHLRNDVRKIIADAVKSTGVVVPEPAPAAVATFAAECAARRRSQSVAARDRYTISWVHEFVLRHDELIVTPASAAA